MRYSAPLDGIRAIAILAVLIFHVSPRTLPGGFTGVDVFFVLSGFLITAIVLHDIRDGTFSLREFYLRRIQRLLPNIIVTVGAVLVLWTIFLPPSTARQTGTHGLWTLFNLSNIYIWKNLGGYWGNAATSAPFTHTWSLGIEEQFYLLFPAALMLLARLAPGRGRLWLAGATGVSFIAGAYWVRLDASAAFYLLPTRIWELLIGATLAAAPVTVTPRLRSILGWTGIALLGAGFVAIDERYAFPGVVALIPTVGTVFVLIAIVDEASTLSRCLSLRVMVATGMLSYSLYLWHWPLIALGRIEADLFGVPPLLGAIGGCAAGIVLAIVVYVAVERPLRHRGAGRRRRLAVIAAGFLLVVSASTLLATRRIVADPDHRFDRTEFHGMLFDAGPTPAIDMASVVHYYDVFFPPHRPRTDAAWRTGGIVHRYGGDRPAVVVLGSSHALMYSRLIDDICRTAGLSVAFLGVDQQSAFFESAADGVHALMPSATEFDDARRRWLREYKPDAVIVMDRWEVRAGSAEDFGTRLRRFVADVGANAARVVWVSQVPVVAGGNTFNLRELAAWRLNTGAGLPRLMPDVHDALRQGIAAAAERVAADVGNLQVIRADRPFYQPDGSMRYVDGRRFLYADDNHLSDAGSEEVRGMLRDAIMGARAASAGR